MTRETNKNIDIMWICTGMMLAGAAALLAMARNVSGFAEWYSKTIYPFLVSTFGRFFGIFPFSVSEAGLYCGIIWLFVMILKYWKTPMRILRDFCAAIALLLFLYSINCGINYYRVSFSVYYRKTFSQNTEITEESLKKMCMWLTKMVNKSRAEIEYADHIYEDMQEKGVSAMEKLAGKYPVLEGFYPKPKPVGVSEILSYQQCSGVYSPFTIEANYNQDMTDYNIPHTICHELSHLRGFMREDEANFIGYLACIGSDEADFRYSGYLLGWIYAGNALAKTDFDTYAELYGMLSETVIEDLDANSQFWDRYEGTVAEVQEAVNDTYLKANGQAEGVKTYGRVVDLMLLEFLKQEE